ncbi:hypothetical protein [Natrarchaeobaculum aegyptiacum]|uniref:Phycocyanobilin lyase n=1 Tax=Natrarchaeobaculum aegyptiacum TaxID=745377 RepID=A0A2Z2HWZ0_9EURY|nr:hypothetical protein [Natrarchaeobaculum aegyptiacum]ARS89474.1 hypothetical protein B1756_06755 [Natrarchaeobaculum aegyptiacum]
MDGTDDLLEAVRSSDADRVNDAIDRVGNLEPAERGALLDETVSDLAAIYDHSDDGYVRQSVVRAADQLCPGLSAAFLIDDGRLEREAVERRADTAGGFFLEAILDADGRVRQSATRGLKDVYRCYDSLEDDESIAAFATELESLAADEDGAIRKHVLESKRDAEFFLQSPGSRLLGSLAREFDL